MSLVVVVSIMIGAKLATTSKATKSLSSHSCWNSLRILPCCFSSIWLEDRGTEGVLGVEGILLELIVGVLVALVLVFVIIVVLAPVELILIIISVPVE